MENHVLSVLEQAKSLEESCDAVSAIRLYNEGMNNIQKLLIQYKEDASGTNLEKVIMFTDLLKYYQDYINIIPRNLAIKAKEYDKTIAKDSTPITLEKIKSLGVSYLNACEAYLEILNSNSTCNNKLKVKLTLTEQDTQTLITCSDRAEALQKQVLQFGGGGSAGGGSAGGGSNTATVASNTSSFSLDLPAAPSNKPNTSTNSNSVPPAPTAAAAASTATTESEFESFNCQMIAANNGQDKILNQSSYIRKKTTTGNGNGNGILYFPKWIEGEDLITDFSIKKGKFTDPDGFLSLSNSQIQVNATYVRVTTHKTKQYNQVSMINPTNTHPYIDAYSISQGMIGDCSFISSLIIAALYDKKVDQMQIKSLSASATASSVGRSPEKRLITSIVYPQDRKTRLPILSPNGKYLVKLFFNGCYRKVVVDDYLPCHSTSGKLVCSTSITVDGRLELWASIIEKAYMKVHGGYNFQGSNSGQDLHALTGWIPEQIFLPKVNVSGSGSGDTLDHRQNPNRVWERLLGGVKHNLNLITVNTTQLTKEEETSTGLASCHAYAVLSVTNVTTSNSTSNSNSTSSDVSLRMLRVKNPWKNTPWKGRYSASDRRSWTSTMKNKLFGTTNENDITDMFNLMEQEGEFFIEYSDLLKYFGGLSEAGTGAGAGAGAGGGIFVNWNPDEVFTYKKSLHEYWPGNMAPQDDRFYTGENPQYTLIINTPAVVTLESTIWVLLSKHELMTCEGNSATDTDTDTTTATNVSDIDEIFMAMHIYKDTNGHRIYENSTTTPYIRGVYSNDKHVLARINVDKTSPTLGDSEASISNSSSNSNSNSRNRNQQKFTIVLSQRDRDPNKHVTYTLSVYGALYNYTLEHAKGPGQHSYYEKDGKFADYDKATYPGSKYYYKNPQWFIQTAPTGHQSIGTGADSGITVHLEAFYTDTIGGNLSISEIPNEKMNKLNLMGLSKEEKLDCLRLDNIPPSIGCVTQKKDQDGKTFKWVSDPYTQSASASGSEELLLHKSSSGYRRGYCHIPRLCLKAGTNYIVVLSKTTKENSSSEPETETGSGAMAGLGMNYRFRFSSNCINCVKILTEIVLPEGRPFPYKYNAPGEFHPNGYQGGKNSKSKGIGADRGQRYITQNNILLLTSANFGLTGTSHVTVKVRLVVDSDSGRGDASGSLASNVAMFSWPLPSPSSAALANCGTGNHALHARHPLAVATSADGIYTENSVSITGTFNSNTMCLIPSLYENLVTEAATTTTATSVGAVKYTLYIYSTAKLDLSWHVPLPPRT